MTTQPRIPTTVWALGFVSLLMDVSSELVHSLLPVFLVTALGASAFVVGLIEGAAEATALIVRVFSGVLSDYWGRRKPLAVRGAAFGLRQALDTVGAFLGPLLAMGLMLLWANDFRAVFGVAIVPGVLAVALLVFGVQEPEKDRSAHPVIPIQRAQLHRLPAAYWKVPRHRARRTRRPSGRYRRTARRPPSAPARFAKDHRDGRGANG